jgi:DNA-binding TFAR19-related protein (PDSD5 family)
MIWNDFKKEFQFPRICETTEKGATTCLFNYIGNNARKDRFQIKKVEKEEAKKIVKELKQKYKAERIHAIIPQINIKTILELVKRNDKEGEEDE